MIEVSLSYNNTLSLELKNLNSKGSVDYLRKLLTVPNIYYDFSMCKFVIPYDSYSILKDLLGEVLLPNFSEYKLTGEKPQPPHIYNESIKPIIVPNAEYHEYQEFGMKFMIDRLMKYGFALNCDSVGLGKTIQAIGVVLYCIKHTNVKRVIIACKKSLKLQWFYDLKNFLFPYMIENGLSHNCDVATIGYDEEGVSSNIENTKAGRIRKYESLKYSEKAILICNYENFIYDTDYIKDFKADLIVIDEVHNISNYETKTNQCIREAVDEQPCILLTGTPITKNIRDIYGIISIASSKYLGSYDDFKSRYLGDKDIPWSTEYRNLNEIKEKLQEVAIRRTPDDTDAEFPEIHGEVKQVSMKDLQKDCFFKISKEIKDLNQKSVELLRKKSRTIDEEKELTVTKDKRTAMLFMEQFVASDINMVFHNETAHNYFKDIFESHSYGSDIPKSQKTKLLLSLVHEIVDNGNKVLIFSYYNECVQYIYKCLREDIDTKIDIVAYHGGMSQKDKDASISAFKYKDNCQVLIGTDAMGEGLNLQIAQYLINYDQPQNTGKKEQRIGRIRRLSSIYNHVIYYDLITTSPDEKYHTRDEQLLSKITGGKIVSDFILEDNVNSEVDATKDIGSIKNIPFGKWNLEQYVRGNKVTYRLYTNTILDEKQFLEAKQMFKGMGAKFDKEAVQWIFYYNPSNMLHLESKRVSATDAIDTNIDLNTIAELFSTSYDNEDIWVIKLKDMDVNSHVKWLEFFYDNKGMNKDYAPGYIVFDEDPSSKFNMTVKKMSPIPKLYSMRKLKCQYLSIPGSHSMFAEPVDNAFALLRYSASKYTKEDIKYDEEIFDHFNIEERVVHDIKGTEFNARIITSDMLKLFDLNKNIYGTIGNYMRTNVAVPKDLRAKKNEEIKVYFEYEDVSSNKDLDICISFYKYENGACNQEHFPNKYYYKNSTTISCGTAITIYFYGKTFKQKVNAKTFLQDYNKIVIEPTLKSNIIKIRCSDKSIIVTCDKCLTVENLK